MSPYRRYRDAAFVVVLLAVPFFFLRASIRDPRQMNALDRAVVKIATPIQYAAGALARGISDLWGDYVYLAQVKQDNDRLVYDNARLRERVRRLESLEAENRRLRRLLGLKESVPGDLVSAQVISKDSVAFFRVASLVVDRGGHDIRPNMPVISLDGVVGQVQRVVGDRVEVRLAVDAGSGIDAVNERTGARGFVRGTGDQNRYLCKADFVQRVDEVDVGDLFVTSGYGRAFPKGIAIARVTKVVKKDFGSYQEVEAVPVVDFSRLDEVLVLTSPPADEPPIPPRGQR